PAATCSCPLGSSQDFNLISILTILAPSLAAILSARWVRTTRPCRRSISWHNPSAHGVSREGEVMASYRGHLTFSTALGAAYGALACWHFGMDWPTAALGGALTAVSGLLPDL